MKPNIIQQIEKQTGKQLTQLTGLENLADAIRYKHNHSYVFENGNLVALNVTETETLTRTEFDETACATLRYLNLSENKNLQSVTFAAALPNLKYLDLSECKLGKLTLPAGCKQLEKAWLQKSGLQEMTFEGPCPKLLLLDLSGNELEEFTLPGGFESLAYLYLAESKVTHLALEHEEREPKSEELKYKTPLPKLEILHLGKNDLELVPTNVVFSDTLKALYLAGNAPKNIPKVFLGSGDSYTAFNCLEDARTWFTEIRDFPHDKNRVVKLMLTGNGNVGKSTLACSMRHGSCDHNHPTTHGILIDALEFDKIAYNIWDFGGQEVYHGTHRLFMSSEALQVILFDTKTEDDARNFKHEKDRIRDDKVLPHPMEYWYETTKKLSPDSEFFIVHNKRSEGERDDAKIVKYAQGKAKFIPLNAKTGEDVDDLMHFLLKNARKLPDYDMTMPESWLKVRLFFIDNLKAENSTKIISKAAFERLCEDNHVMSKSRPLLFKYLHHNGFLYYHENLKDNIIADQRWALKAIYRPYDRKADHYQEFLDLKGKIRVRHLFQIFDTKTKEEENQQKNHKYTEEEKWLFLDFMKSCGLCFQLNNKPWQESKDESDVYVFPEFLPDEKPESVKTVWESKAKDVHVLRYRLPWLNYYVIQSFITALGRKTESENFWRYGIHVLTLEGWFKVELDYDQRALLLHIEKSAMATWLKPILEELKVDHGKDGWEVSVKGAPFEPFNPEKWKEEEPHKLAERQMQMEDKKAEKEPLEKLPEVEQQLDRQVILFVAANPPETGKLGSQEKEYAQISRKTRGKFDVVDLFAASTAELNDEISRWSPQVIHFCGHAEAEGLAFHDKYKRVEQILEVETLIPFFESIKEDFPKLEIVFLNACSSDKSAQAISQNQIYTIGTSGELTSYHAIPFAEGFYSRYAESGNVTLSVRHGIRQVLMETNDNKKGLIQLFFNGNPITI